MLGRERHGGEDVAVTHVRIVEPGVTEAVLLGHLHVLPGADICWIADSELHLRLPPRNRSVENPAGGECARKACQRRVLSIALLGGKRNAGRSRSRAAGPAIVSAASRGHCCPLLREVLMILRGMARSWSCAPDPREPFRSIQ